MKHIPLIVAVIVFVAPQVMASPGHVYELDWDVPGEIATYNSMGCADECWVARLMDKKSRKVKIELRCEGLNYPLQLTVAYNGSKKRQPYKESCESYSKSDDKLGLITKDLEQLSKK